MSLPREVLAGRSYLITRRCTQRQFLMRPDEKTTNAFVYCLALAASRYGIEILFTVAMSNHHHTGIHDVSGNYPAFLEHFHKLFAKCQNALRGRWENFWAAEQTSVVRLTSSEDVMEKLVYAITNPVKDHLVEKAADWPGVNSYESMLDGSAMHAVRPDHFFRVDGGMPSKITLQFQRSIGFKELSPVMWAKLLKGKVREVEIQVRGEHRAKGTKPPGAKAILRQDWRSHPKKVEPRRSLSPRVAAKNKWRRVEALLQNRAFQLDYREAFEAFQLGFRMALFPEGTYWLKRFAYVLRACDISFAPQELTAA